MKIESEEMKKLYKEKESIETEIIDGVRYHRTPTPKETIRLQEIYNTILNKKLRKNKILDTIESAIDTRDFMLKVQKLNKRGRTKKGGGMSL